MNNFEMKYDHLKQFLSPDTKRKIEDSTLTWVDYNNIEIQVCKVLWKRLWFLPHKSNVIMGIMKELFQSR